MDANCHKTPNEEDDLRNDFKKGDLSDWTLPGLMSLDCCCNIQIVESEFGVKNIK